MIPTEEQAASGQRAEIECRIENAECRIIGSATQLYKVELGE